MTPPKKPPPPVQIPLPINHVLIGLIVCIAAVASASYVAWSASHFLRVRPLELQTDSLRKLLDSKNAELVSAIRISVATLDAAPVAAPVEPVAEIPAPQAIQQPVADRQNPPKRPQDRQEKPPAVIAKGVTAPVSRAQSTTAQAPVLPQEQPAPAVEQPVAAPVAALPEASRTKEPEKIKPRFNVSFKDAGIKGIEDGVVHFLSGRQTRIGQRLGSGETLVAVDPSARVITTDQRIIVLRAE